MNGVKTLISRVDEAQAFVVFSRIDRHAGPRRHRLRAGRARHAGIRRAPARYHTMGGENLAEIQFKNCELPLRERDHPRGRIQQAAERVQHAALPESQRSRSVSPKARSRRRSSTRAIARLSASPIGEFQGDALEARGDVPRHRGRPRPCCIARAPTAESVSRTRTWRRSRRCTVNEMAMRVTSEAIQVHGGYGFTDEYPGVALLPRRALRHARRRHDRDAEGPGRQEDDEVISPATASSAWGRSDVRRSSRSYLFVPGDDAKVDEGARVPGRCADPRSRGLGRPTRKAARARELWPPSSVAATRNDAAVRAGERAGDRPRARRSRRGGARRPYGIMLPKCAGGAMWRGRANISTLEAREGSSPDGRRILPIVTESAAAVLAIRAMRGQDRASGHALGRRGSRRRRRRFRNRRRGRLRAAVRARARSCACSRRRPRGPGRSTRSTRISATTRACVPRREAAVRAGFGARRRSIPARSRSINEAFTPSDDALRRGGGDRRRPERREERRGSERTPRRGAASEESPQDPGAGRPTGSSRRPPEGRGF